LLPRILNRTEPIFAHERFLERSWPVDVSKWGLYPQLGLWSAPDWRQSLKTSNMWHDGTLSIRNCTLVMIQLKNLSFEPLCSDTLAISGHNQVKVPKLYKYSMMVLYRSEI
jgi:hypothetical protein